MGKLEQSQPMYEQEAAMNRRKAFVFDFDGVIADIRHRYHYIQGVNKDKPDWDGFFADEETAKDVPSIATRNLMNVLYAAGADVIILTARPTKTTKASVLWLHEHGFHWSSLVLRPDNDHYQQSAGAWKKIKMNELLKEREVLGFFDDSTNNVKAVETLGVPSILYGIGSIR